MRILLAEDNPELSAWLAKLLRRDNYVIDCVRDGEAADEALLSQDYALVILDLSLPRLGGLEVLKKPAPPGQGHARSDSHRQRHGREPGCRTGRRRG